MKRIIILITALLFIATMNMDAQIKLGAKIGTNQNSAHIDRTLFDSTNRSGFLFGPMVDLKIPFFGLGFDAALQYNYRKAQLDAIDESENKSGVSSFHTIEIPFNLKWTLGNDHIASIYAATGPQFAWNIGGRSLENILDRHQYKMRNAIYSWNLGAGCTFFSRVRLGYTYNIALGESVEILYIKDTGSLVHSKLKNNTHQFFFVVLF